MNVRYYRSDVPLLTGMVVGTGGVTPSGFYRVASDFTVVAIASPPTTWALTRSSAFRSDEPSEKLPLDSAECETEGTAPLPDGASELYYPCMWCTGNNHVTETYTCTDGNTLSYKVYEMVIGTEYRPKEKPGEDIYAGTYAELAKQYMKNEQ